MQVVGREIHLIEASGADLGHYVSKLRERGYSDAGHIVPHDAEAKELGTGKSRLEAMESLGLGNIQVCVKHFVPDGINAGRVMNPKCWFDVKKCESCANGLSSYSDPTLGVRNRVGKLRGPGVAAQLRSSTTSKRKHWIGINFKGGTCGFFGKTCNRCGETKCRFYLLFVP